MAKKDLDKNVITVEKKDEVKNPYASKTREEMLELLVSKDGLINGYKTEIDKLNKQIEDCKKEYDGMTEKSQEVISKYKELEAEDEKLKSAHAAEIDELNEDHEAEIEKLNETHAAEIEELKDTYEAKLAGQTEADAKKLEDLRKSYEDDLKGAKASSDDEVAKLKNDHKEALKKQAAKLENDWQKKLDRAQTKYNAEIKRLNDRIAELTTLGTEGIYSQNLRDDFLAASKKERERLIKLLIAELEESDNNLNGTFDKLKTKAEKKVTRKKEAKKAIDEAKERLAWLEQQNEHNNAERASIEDSLDRIYKMLEDDVEDDA